MKVLTLYPFLNCYKTQIFTFDVATQLYNKIQKRFMPTLRADDNVSTTIPNWCQFHQRFFKRFFPTNVVSAAFSCYVLALSKNLYEKCARKTLMKLTAGE